MSAGKYLIVSASYGEHPADNALYGPASVEELASCAYARLKNHLDESQEEFISRLTQHGYYTEGQVHAEICTALPVVTSKN